MTAEALSDDELDAISDLERSKDKPAATPRAVPDLIDPQQLYADVQINDTDLDESVFKQAGLVAHYGVLHAKAELEVNRRKMLLEALEAKLDGEVRDELTAAGTKITESLVDKAIKRDTRYIKAMDNLNKAKMQETMAKNAMKSLSDKRDMLIQIGSDRRKDMDGTLRVMVEEAARDRRQQFTQDLARAKRGE